MKRFLIIVFLFPVLLLFWLWYTFVGPGYWAEYKDIKAELEKISELEIKELGYNKDITLEDIWAVLHVKGKGDLTVYGLTREFSAASARSLMTALEVASCPAPLP